MALNLAIIGEPVKLMTVIVDTWQFQGSPHRRVAP